jgi:hypothetical protein
VKVNAEGREALEVGCEPRLEVPQRSTRQRRPEDLGEGALAGERHVLHLRVDGEVLGPELRLAAEDVAVELGRDSYTWEIGM